MKPEKRLEPNQVTGLVGTNIEFQDEGTATVTDETADSLYLVSKFFTGWMYKAEFFELLSAEN